MSDSLLNSPPVVITRTELLRQMVEERKLQVRLQRSTYTEKNAVTFKPYYDLAISQQKDLLIKLEWFPNNNITTLYKKVCDGLLFIRNRLQDETKALEYHILRAQVEMMRVATPEPGILMHFTTGHEYRAKEAIDLAATKKEFKTFASEDNVPPTNVQDFKQLLIDIEKYIATGKSMFVREDLTLSEAEVKQVVGMCDQNEVACDIQPTKIRIFKV